MGRTSTGKGLWGIALGLCVIASGCSDAVVFSGSYREEVPEPDPTTGKYARDFAVAIDLFQFGDELGGIVRYHSLREVEGRAESPFDNPEKVCFWTDVTRVDADTQQIRLAYEDDRRLLNDLVIQPTDVEGEFVAQRVIFAGDSADIEQQALRLQRIEEGEADPVCDRDNEDFRVTIQLGEFDGLRRGERAGDLCPQNAGGDAVCAPLSLQCDPLTGACLPPVTCPETCGEDERCSPRTGRCEPKAPPGKLTVAMVWVGPARDESVNSEVFTWAHRLATLQTNIEPTQIDIVRNLPPGQWEPLSIPYVTVGGARVAMGQVLVYRDLDADDERDATEVRADWDKSEEPLVGSTFDAVGTGGTGRQGQVILYVDGDPATLSEGFLSLFPRDSPPPVEGYGVYELTYDVDNPQTFTLRRQNINVVRVHLRPWEDALMADDIDKNLPRIPNL